MLEYILAKLTLNWHPLSVQTSRVNEKFLCLKLHVPSTSTGCTIQKIAESDLCQQCSQVSFRKDFEKRTCSKSPVQDMKPQKLMLLLGHLLPQNSLLDGSSLSTRSIKFGPLSTTLVDASQNRRIPFTGKIIYRSIIDWNYSENNCIDLQFM